MPKVAFQVGEIVAHPTEKCSMRVASVDGSRALCQWPLTTKSNSDWFPVAKLKRLRSAPMKVRLR